MLRHTLKSIRALPSRRRSLLASAIGIAGCALLAGCGAASTQGAKAPAKKVQTKTPAAAVAEAPRPDGPPGHWRLVLNSDFSTGPLDTAIWHRGWFGTGLSGPINPHELACYRAKNVTSPGDGALDLALTHVPSRCGGRTRPYSGAVISTDPRDGRPQGGFEYRYGVAEAKIYIPAYPRNLIANWPAFETFGQSWPRTGEDDIVEGVGGTICSEFHSSVSPEPGLGGCDPGVTPGWHTVTADWEPKSITWYYDGIRILRETKGVTTEPMYLVVVNTASQKWARLTETSTVKVAYVRVWQPAGKLSNRAKYQYAF